MADSKTLDLFVPVEHHSTTIARIELRQPSGGLYAELGEPRLAVRTGTGFYFVEQPDVIRRYLDKCIVHQDGAELLKLMSLPDVIALKDELFGFFTAAEAIVIARKQTTSSSAPKS